MVNCLVLWSVDNTLLVCLAGALAKYIPSITPRWELVGHALDVGQTVLTIRGTERDPNSKCLCVLEAWVEAGKEVSRKKLLDVLQDQQLNETVQKIRQSLQGEEDVSY